METVPLKEEEEKPNIVPFQVVQGGKQPPGDNWLRDLPPTTKFIAREKRRKDQAITCLCYEFLLGYHTEFCTYLLVYPGQMEMLVITKEFSHDYERIEILPDVPLIQSE